MIKKIRIFIYILLNVKFHILKNVKKKYVIFDKEGIDYTTKILPDNSYFILETRPHDLKKFYISQKILLNFLKNYFIKKKNLFNSYLISVIEEVNPKIVITIIDNSLKFFEISRSLEKNYKFIAIQNSARYDILRYKFEYKKKIRESDLSKNFYLPNFYSFGDYERDHYLKNNIYVKNFSKIGSLKLMLAMKYLKDKQEKLISEKYDICLLSDDAEDFNKNFKEKNLESEYALIAKYTIQYAKKNNKKFIFSWKRDKANTDHQKEYNFYKRNLSDQEFDYLLNNAIYKEEPYHSYKAIIQSKIVIGVSTTMLREKLSLKGKILTCNYTSLSLFNFPIDSIFVLKRYGYDNFEKKINFLLNMNSEDHKKELENLGEYIIKYYNENDLDELKKILN